MSNSGIKCKVTKIFIRPELKVKTDLLEDTIKTAIDSKTKTARFENYSTQTIMISSFSESPTV